MPDKEHETAGLQFDLETNFAEMLFHGLEPWKKFVI